MDENKILEIKNIAIEKINNSENIADIARDIEQGFIFGKYANNEHYNIDDIVRIVNEVVNELKSGGE